MISLQTRTVELSGTNYEIGYQLGKRVSEIPSLKKMHTGGMEGFNSEKVKEAKILFDHWCPGLTEELNGFADALDARPEQIFYYGMTYLLPRCSQIAILPKASADGKPLLARNYEFNHEAEDFCLVKTSVAGKYTHLGTSVLNFGRDDGFNEHGLVVTMSSCGFPVGGLPYMRGARIKGLQFWAVIRTLLENCKNVEEALDYIKEIPISYNLNLMIMDKSGNVALVETFDGKFVFEMLDENSTKQMIWATNHPVLPEIIPYEPRAFVHSAKRYQWIEEQIKGGNITADKLKEMLLSEYPDGLCCHYYEEFFGTTKSMVVSPVDGTIELCWGGRIENGWNSYNINMPLVEEMRTIEIDLKKANPAIYEYEPIKY